MRSGFWHSRSSLHCCRYCCRYYCQSYAPFSSLRSSFSPRASHSASYSSDRPPPSTSFPVFWECVASVLVPALETADYSSKPPTGSPGWLRVPYTLGPSDSVFSPRKEKINSWWFFQICLSMVEDASHDSQSHSFFDSDKSSLFQFTLQFPRKASYKVQLRATTTRWKNDASIRLEMYTFKKEWCLRRSLRFLVIWEHFLRDVMIILYARIIRDDYVSAITALRYVI